MVFCAQCGTKGKDGAKFCSSCGAPLKSPASGASSSPAASAPSFNPDPPPQQAAAPAPPGTFQVRLPQNVVPGQVMQVRVPAGFAQEGQLSQFRVPPGAKPGGLVHAPLPQNQSPAAGGYGGGDRYGGYGGGPAYGGGGGGYGQPVYQQQNNRPGMGGALAAGAVGGIGGMLLADAMFDGSDGGGFGDF